MNRWIQTDSTLKADDILVYRKKIPLSLSPYIPKHFLHLKIFNSMKNT